MIVNPSPVSTGDSCYLKSAGTHDANCESSEPDPSKVRKWTDRTKAFTVEAQFIGLQDGKIHLHKVNGIKIAVPVAKMSVDDLEYVEKTANVSLDEDKPLSSIRKRATSDAKQTGNSGASVQRPEYDWFDFFLKAGVGPHQCERYAQNFLKDSMDESVLADISPETLRSLGLKEGDILRVMRHLDTSLGRTGSKSKPRNVSFGGEEVIGDGEDGGQGGLFAGPGGTLRNNTRKGRPTPSVQAGDVVDPKAFEQADASKPKEERAATPPAPPAPEKEEPVTRGFDDDAWEVKQPKQPTVSTSAASIPQPATTTSPTVPQPPIQKQVTGAMADLSLLQAPLQPTQAQPAPVPAPQPVSSIPALQPQQTAVQAPPQQPQHTGATPGFFNQIAQMGQQARQRPQPPQNANQNSLLPPPPPQRPLSAPQNFAQQQSTFSPPPLQPQLTGVPQAGPPVAPPGQSLAELNQQRFQPQMQPQATGFMGQGQFQNGLMPQPTGFTPQSQFGIQQQQQLNGQPMMPNQTGFQGMAPQPTGFGGFAQPQQPMQTGINSVLPPALQPQQTGANGFGNASYNQPPPPVPPIPQQPTAAPLTAQKTGPPPSIRFGVKPDAPKKLAPQPTGMRANLSQASKSSQIYLSLRCG